MASVKMSPLRLSAIIALLPLTMFGLGFAAKPLYDTFCRITGFGGTIKQTTQKSGKILERKIQIRFDASNLSESLDFYPAENSITLNLGETAMAWYQVTNHSNNAIAAIASYNVIPHKAGRFFSKLECFCFEQQSFKPGQSYRLPVIFFIDPKLDEYSWFDDIQFITLSYTLHAETENTAKETSYDP